MKKETAAPNQLCMDGSTRQQKLYDYAIDLLKLAQPQEGYYLATSFGKDSIAVQRLADEAGVKYDAHHNITGIDPPELVYFGREYYPNVRRHMYTSSMWRLIVKKGILPMRTRRYCCEVLKEDSGTNRTCIMGIRAEESDRRAKSWAPFSERNGKKADNLRMFDNDDIQTAIQSCVPKGKVVVNPIYYWTAADLWAFIKDRKMPYCELYDQGFDRLGCIGCPMAKERERTEHFKWYPKFYDAYIRAINKLRENGKFLSFSSADEVMDWWLSDKTQEKPIDGQLEIENIDEME